MKKLALLKKKLYLSSKIIIFVMIFVFSFILLVKAEYNLFLNQISDMGINTDIIKKSKSISRYDVARLLNASECNDCINTSDEFMSKYSNNFWSEFLKIPGKDFDDIKYKGGIYKGESYYYCVAYVGYSNYMRGYPKDLSSVCGGMFCGEKNTTQAEFIQVVINMSAKHIYKNFYVDRSKVKKWMNKLKNDSNAYKYLDEIDRNYINENSNENKSGYIDDVKYFQTYMKYCMFNLKECGFSEFGKIKQGYRPISELNVLFDQNIIDLPIARNINLSDDMDGKTVLDVFYKLNGMIKCGFDSDYDCDGIINSQDNCVNDYNPKQSDYDKDGIGDVCDDDIDGDGIKNPVGIVDDNNRVNINLWKTGTDLNLFGPNISKDNNIGLYLDLKKLSGKAPLTVEVSAVTWGVVDKITRDMGDNTQLEGSKIKHTFIDSGLYKIKAIAESKTKKIESEINILVGENTDNHNGMQIFASKIGSNKDNLETTFQLSNIGKLDMIKWNFGDGIEIEKKPNERIKKLIINKGNYRVFAKGYRGGELVGIASILIGVGSGSYGMAIKTDTLNPIIGQKIGLKTDIYGFENNDIENIIIDRGDGKKSNIKNLSSEHSYDIAGNKVITKTIHLKNGQKISNFLSLYVVDTTILKSYSFVLKPNSLTQNIYSKFLFNTQIIGDTLGNYPLLINQYKPGITEKFINLNYTNANFNHIYNNPGMYEIKSSLYINQCISMKAKANIVIRGNDLCLDALLGNNLNNYKCDMDKDGIPDICDDDIDGDGYKNLIGIIKFENPDCSIGKNNIDLELLKKHIGNCSLDNAFYMPNSGNLDLNLNGIGDDFESQILPLIDDFMKTDKLDDDGDGIENSLDLCPNIAETYNLIQDDDGCPEIGINLNCNTKFQMSNLGGFQNTLTGILGENLTGLIQNILTGILGNTGLYFLQNGGIIILGGGIFEGQGIPIVGSGLVLVFSGSSSICNGLGITWSDGLIDSIGGLTKLNDKYFIGNSGFVKGSGGLINGCEGLKNVNGLGVIWIGLSYNNLLTNGYNGSEINLSGINGGIINEYLPIPPIIKFDCNKCPCNFVDIVNDLNKKDAVRASLKNLNQNILYKNSSPEYLDLYFRN